MANYLFTLTITPVQSFISQARKTKDLFSGSEILSNLMKQTLGSEVLTSQYIEFIYPYIPDKTDEVKTSFPNKFICKVKTEDIKDIGKKLENSINNEFYLLASKTLLSNMVKYHFPVNTQFIEEHFKTQLCDFFQTFWVAVELPENYTDEEYKNEEYKNRYKRLEQNLGAIKNLRKFTQLEQISGRKCSVCGERNGLFYNSNQKPRYIIENAIRIKDNQIKENETLCAVCFTKRFSKGSYPSTAKIALPDWLKKVPNSNEYKKLFKQPFDESLYFKENLSKEYLTKWEYFKSDDDLQKAIKFLDNLDIEIKQKKYYALIQFDIDDMGKKLSSLDEDGQRELSKALGEFAQKAKNIVDTQNNNVDKTECTIYAGGDDFLGFVNLAYLFEVMEEIQNSFNDEVKTSLPDLSYSTSIVIVHYKTQLDKVLKYSRTTLDNAKSKFKTPPKAFKIPKNAMGITYITKSNNISTTYFYKERAETFFLLNSILKDKTTPILSSKFIFNLEQEFKKINLENIDDIDEIDTLIDMINIELKRLLKRASADFDKDVNEKKKQLQKLYQQLSEFTYDGWSEKEKSFDFDNYMMFLKIADAMNGER